VDQAQFLSSQIVQQDFREEAFIISNSVPTLLCSTASAASAAALGNGATILIYCGLCDQRNDFSFVVSLLDGNSSGEQDNQVLSLHAFTNADSIISVSSDKNCICTMNNQHGNKQIHKACLYLDANTLPKGAKLVGFTGLHDGGLFYQLLIRNNYNVRGFVPLADAGGYMEKPMKGLVRMASSQSAVLVTTRSDYMRVPKKIKHSVVPLKIVAVLDDAVVDEITMACNFTQERSAQAVR
jgi:hypothetical protein